MNEKDNNKEELLSTSEIGARKGAYFGIYLVVLYLAVVNSGGSSFVAAFALTMMVGVPIVLYRMLRGIYLYEDCQSSYMRIFSSGVSIFFFASIILGLAIYVWMQYVHPGYLYEMAQEAIKAYDQVPDLRSTPMVQALKAAVKNGDLPTSIQFAIQMMWATLMSGALLTAVMAAVARMGSGNRPSGMSRN